VKANFTLMYPLLEPASLRSIYLHFPDPNMEQRVCNALGPEKADELRELPGIVVAALSPSADDD
jgi:hypothetical protein